MERQESPAPRHRPSYLNHAACGGDALGRSQQNRDTRCPSSHIACLDRHPVNSLCALTLVKYRHEGGSRIRAAFLSARNDVAANVAIIIAGVVTAATGSFMPDLIVGLGIGLLNLNAAHEVYSAAKQEGLAR